MRGERKHKTSKTKTSKSSSALKGLVPSNVIPGTSKSKATKRHVSTTATVAAATTITTKDERPSKEPKKSVPPRKKQAITSIDKEEATPTTTTIDNAFVKSRNPQAKAKSSPKHNEVIDYSMDSSKLSAFGKVHQWLLDSPNTKVPSSSSTNSQELENLPAKARQISKSQSTPTGLTQRPPKKVKSVSNLNDKVKLQVVYKPPFKLSLKLSKNSAVKTKVMNNTNNAIESGRTHRNGRIDKTRKVRTANNEKSHRTALLIRSRDGNDTDKGLLFNLKPNRSSPEDRQQLMPTEQKRESLNSHADHQLNDAITANSDENSTFNHPPIDTGTYRINKSASGSNIKNNIHTLNDIDCPIKRRDSKTSSRRASLANSFIVRPLNAENSSMSITSNSNNINSNVRPSTENHSNISSNRGSTSNLNKEFRNSHKLMRSSTTNLSKNRSNRNSFDKKHRYDNIKRSSTTNLSKDRHHGSQLSLLKHQQLRGSISIEDVTLPSAFGNTSTSSSSNSGGGATKSRRSTITNQIVAAEQPVIKTNTPCAQNNSKLKIGLLEHGNISNNIPRASLNMDMSTKHSLNSAQENREIS